MNGRKYTPTPGRCVIQFKDHFAEARASGLALPDMVSDRRDSIGTVLAINPRPNEPCIVKVGDRVIVPPYVAGVKIGDSMEIVQITDITAVIQGEGDITAAIPQDIPRCRFCGPAKSEISSNGVMMEEAGVNGELICPRCGRDQNGLIPDDTPKISDDEVHDLRRSLGREQ